MKDLSYLQAFTVKTLRSAKRVMIQGFTVEDINTFLEDPDKHRLAKGALGGKLVKPCCKEDKEGG